MLSIDIQYLCLIPLKGFKKIDDTKWNFRCPICGDSKRSNSLKRGNAQVWRNDLFIRCFNCQYSKPFSYLIKNSFPDYYKSYLIDKLRSRNVKINIKYDQPVVKRLYTNIELPTVSSLPRSHIAMVEVTRRKIPKSYHSKLYYADNYKKWVNTIIPNKFKMVGKGDKRLVIPFFNKFKQLIGMQGRTLEGRSPKYSTIKLDESADLLYGMDTLDTTKLIYVVEGPIDSMFIPNSIATCTAISKFDVLKKIAPVESFVLIYDNEKRNGVTVNYMRRALELDFKIVLWPKYMKEKDINDIILKKSFTSSKLCDIISENVVEGVAGVAKLNFWRR